MVGTEVFNSPSFEKLNDFLQPQLLTKLVEPFSTICLKSLPSLTFKIIKRNNYLFFSRNLASKIIIYIIYTEKQIFIGLFHEIGRDEMKKIYT